MSKLSDRVLILNKSWIPITTTPVRRAMVLLYEGDARVICPVSYQTYDFEEWVQRSGSEEPKESDIITPRFRIGKPEIMILTKFNGLQKRKVRMTRRNLYKRDGGACQYCGKLVKSDMSSIDHIIPRCRGGRTVWTNCVIACTKCNTRKADKTPEQVGFKLLKQPTKPTWNAIDDVSDSKVPESWKKLLAPKE